MYHDDILCYTYIRYVILIETYHTWTIHSCYNFNS